MDKTKKLADGSGRDHKKSELALRKKKQKTEKEVHTWVHEKYDTDMTKYAAELRALQVLMLPRIL